MEGLDQFVPLMIVMSCVVVTLSFLLLGVNALLNTKIDPIKKDIAKLEAGQAKLESGQAKLEKRMDGIEAKLDQLLARS